MKACILALCVLQTVAFQSRVFPSNRLKANKPLQQTDDNMLGEQLKEFVEGVEKFQEDAYNQVYGKDVSKKRQEINPLVRLIALSCVDQMEEFDIR